MPGCFFAALIRPALRHRRPRESGAVYRGADVLVITVGMVVLFVAAAGKFLAVFVPFTEVQCQVGMAVIALLYTMISGLYGVIWMDVVQAGLIAFAAIYVAVLATTFVTPELMENWPGAQYNSAVPMVGEGLIEYGPRIMIETLGFGENVGVIVQNDAFTDIAILSTVGLSSLVGCLVGTFASRPVDTDTLNASYEQISPLGLWPREWKAPDQAEHRGDLIRLVVAVVWQVSTFMLPMVLMLRMWTAGVIIGTVFLITGVILLRDAQDAGRDATLTTPS